MVLNRTRVESVQTICIFFSLPERFVSRMPRAEVARVTDGNLLKLNLDRYLIKKYSNCFSCGERSPFLSENACKNDNFSSSWILSIWNSFERDNKLNGFPAMWIRLPISVSILGNIGVKGYGIFNCGRFNGGKIVFMNYELRWLKDEVAVSLYSISSWQTIWPLG